MDIDMNGVKIREVTALDKENVLSIRDSAKPCLDTLPALFDYYFAIPNAYLAGVFHEEKLVGFMVGHIVDGGKTCILRCGRAAPEFEGRGLMKLLLRHVGRWGYISGAQTVLSLAHKIPASTSGTTFKIIYTWRWNEVTYTPDKHIRWAMVEEEDEAGKLENISDEILSTIFNQEKTRDYIAPKDVIMIWWTPLKTITENIPTIRGVEGSTNIYCDIISGPDGCSGLLTCCTKYKAAPGFQRDFNFCLDIFGSDLTSLRKHVVRHLSDVKEASEGSVSLEVCLPDGVEWDGVIPVFNEFGINLEKDGVFTNTYTFEWWRRKNATQC